MKNDLVRKARRRWGWFALVLVVALVYFEWFVPNFGWGASALGALFSLLFELFIFMMFAVMQFVAIFWFLGRARVYWLGPGESGVTFADYRGNREILDLAGRVVTLLRGVKTFKDMGGEVPRGLLLVGPPGTGKSYLAQAIATEAGVPFCYSSAPSFQNMFFGVGNLRIMMIYNAARKKAREHGAAIVFIDEIDAIGMSRSGQSGAMGMFGGGGMGLLNELLLQMDPPTIDYSWSGRMMRTFGLRRGRAQTYPVLTIGASVTGDTPILVRSGDDVRRLPIGEFVDSFYETGAADHQVAIAGWRALGYRGLENARLGGRGDRNYFGRAEFVDVKGVFRHRVDHVYEVEYLGGRIRATGDHSVFVRNVDGRGRIGPKRVDQLRPGDVLVNLPYKVNTGNVGRSADRAFGKAETAPTLSLAPYRSTRYASRADMHVAPESVEVDPDFCRLLGYFLAEGFAGKSQIDFCFNRRETALADDVKRLMERYFGAPRLRERVVGEARHLVFHSVQVAKFLRDHVGRDAPSKRVPNFLFTSERESFVEFLRGYASGDGSTSAAGELTLVSVNRELALDVQWLCRMHGIKSAFGSYRVAERRIAPGTGILKSTVAYRVKIGKRSNPFLDRPFPFTYVKRPVVRRVTRLPFDGYVYDLCGCENEAFFGGESPVLLHNTNLPDVLDTALLRPGRFDQKLTIDAPDMVGRIDILQYYLGKTKHDADFPVERAAGDTIGYTPVMIKHVINEGAVFAHFAGREQVTYPDFTAAREGYEWGLRQPIQRMNSEDRRRLAYHEAGHAVAQYLLLPSERVVKVTIIRHGRALGLSASKPLEERHTQSEAEIMCEIEVNLASRAAEEIFLGMKLNGVTQDLMTATHLAAAAIGWFGMDGSLYSYRAFNETVPDASAKRRIDKLLDRAYRSVYALLDANRRFVEAVAEGLMAHEELTGEEVGDLAQRTDASMIVRP